MLQQGFPAPTARPPLPRRPARAAAAAAPLPCAARRCASHAPRRCVRARALLLQPLEQLLQPLAQLPPHPPLALPGPLLQLSAGLEAPVQLLYLGTLLALLSAAAFLVVRQALRRSELEAASKALGERVRAGSATPAEHYEMGAVLLRKKVYGAAAKSLARALQEWDGAADPAGKAQVHNALGFALAAPVSEDGEGVGPAGLAAGIEQYRLAVSLLPGYVVAWNNLGAALEAAKRPGEALEAYEAALRSDPGNGTARERAGALAQRADRLAGTSGGR